MKILVSPIPIPLSEPKLTVRMMMMIAAAASDLNAISEVNHYFPDIQTYTQSCPYRVQSSNTSTAVS